MTHRLTFSPTAADAYRKLKADPASAGILRVVDRALDQLQLDPGHYSVRRTSLVAEIWNGRRLWAISVRPPKDDDWLILWTEKDDHPHVVAISTAP